MREGREFFFPVGAYGIYCLYNFRVEERIGHELDVPAPAPVRLIVRRMIAVDYLTNVLSQWL